MVVKISGLNGRISDVSDIHRPPVKKQKRNEEMSGFSDITKIIVSPPIKPVSEPSIMLETTTPLLLPVPIKVKAVSVPIKRKIDKLPVSSANVPDTLPVSSATVSGSTVTPPLLSVVTNNDPVFS